MWTAETRLRFNCSKLQVSLPRNTEKHCGRPFQYEPRSRGQSLVSSAWGCFPNRKNNAGKGRTEKGKKERKLEITNQTLLSFLTWIWHWTVEKQKKKENLQKFQISFYWPLCEIVEKCFNFRFWWVNLDHKETLNRLISNPAQSPKFVSPEAVSAVRLF